MKQLSKHESFIGFVCLYCVSIQHYIHHPFCYHLSVCDIKREILLLKARMHQEFNINKTPPTYEPREFENLCHSAGALTIFGTILNAMTDPRRSQQRLRTNQKRTVAIIYKLCFGLSQVCNWLQTDHVLFLKESNLNQKGLQAQKEIGNSCCRRKVKHLYQELAQSNTKKSRRANLGGYRPQVTTRINNRRLYVNTE